MLSEHLNQDHESSWLLTAQYELPDIFDSDLFPSSSISSPLPDISDGWPSFLRSNSAELSNSQSFTSFSAPAPSAEEFKQGDIWYDDGPVLRSIQAEDLFGDPTCIVHECMGKNEITVQEGFTSRAPMAYSFTDEFSDLNRVSSEVNNVHGSPLREEKIEEEEKKRASKQKKTVMHEKNSLNTSPLDDHPSELITVEGPVEVLDQWMEELFNIINNTPSSFSSEDQWSSVAKSLVIPLDDPLTPSSPWHVNSISTSSSDSSDRFSALYDKQKIQNGATENFQQSLQSFVGTVEDMSGNKPTLSSISHDGIRPKDVSSSVVNNVIRSKDLSSSVVHNGIFRPKDMSSSVVNNATRSKDISSSVVHNGIFRPKDVSNLVDRNGIRSKDVSSSVVRNGRFRPKDMSSSVVNNATRSKDISSSSVHNGIFRPKDVSNLVDRNGIRSKDISSSVVHNGIFRSKDLTSSVTLHDDIRSKDVSSSIVHNGIFKPKDISSLVARNPIRLKNVSGLVAQNGTRPNDALTLVSNDRVGSIKRALVDNNDIDNSHVDPVKNYGIIPYMTNKESIGNHYVKVLSDNHETFISYVKNKDLNAEGHAIVLIHGLEYIWNKLANLNFKSSVEKNGKLKGSRRTVEYTSADLTNLLLTCSQAIGIGNLQRAHELLKEIRQDASPYGNDLQRVAYYFSEGLVARLSGTGGLLYNALKNNSPAREKLLKAYHLYVNVCPFNKARNYFANRAIIKAAKGSSRLHIVDYGILDGFQWPALISALAGRVGGPPHLRITGIDFPQQGEQPSKKVETTGRCLAEYAKTYGVPFAYRPVVTDWENVKASTLDLREDEVLVVNCSNRLHHLFDETVVGSNPRVTVLKNIMDINPTIFVQGIWNGNYNTPFFMSRFKEALTLYASFFNMLESTFSCDNQERMLIEREFMGRDILNIIACEGLERVERPETYRQWQTLTQKVGFVQISLDQDMMRDMPPLIKHVYNKNFSVEQDGCWLLLGWKGKVFHGLSLWKPSPIPNAPKFS